MTSRIESVAMVIATAHKEGRDQVVSELLNKLCRHFDNAVEENYRDNIIRESALKTYETELMKNEDDIIKTKSFDRIMKALDAALHIAPPVKYAIAYMKLNQVKI